MTTKIACRGSECEIHHVTPHADGGPTSIQNGVLVHRDCHPKRKEVYQLGILRVVAQTVLTLFHKKKYQKILNITK